MFAKDGFYPRRVPLLILGEPVFHIPGGRCYHCTKINTVEGERWFCKEA